MYSTGRDVCVISYFVAHVSFWLCFFCLTIVHRTFRELGFGEKPLPFILSSHLRESIHIREYIRGWITGATLHIIYHHSIRIWEWFQGALTI
jgi:hypothetical protein